MTPELKASLLGLFIQYAVPPLFTLAGSALVWLLVQASKLVGEKVKNEKVGGLITKLLTHVETVVRDVEQTLVPMVKEAAADGVITKEEAAKIREAALAKVKDHLGISGLKEIMDVFGLGPDKVDSFLSSHIEAAVNRLKVETAGNPR